MLQNLYDKSLQRWVNVLQNKISTALKKRGLASAKMSEKIKPA